MQLVLGVALCGCGSEPATPSGAGASQPKGADASKPDSPEKPTKATTPSPTVDERCNIDVKGEEARIDKAAVRVVKSNDIRRAQVEGDGKTVGYDCPTSVQGKVQLLARYDNGEEKEYDPVDVTPQNRGKLDASQGRAISKENQERLEKLYGPRRVEETAPDATGTGEVPAADEGSSTGGASDPSDAPDPSGASDPSGAPTPDGPDSPTEPVKVVFQQNELDWAQFKITGNGQTAQSKKLNGTQKTLKLVPGTYRVSLKEDSDDPYKKVRRKLKISAGRSYTVKLLRDPLDFKQDPPS